VLKADLAMDLLDLDSESHRLVRAPMRLLLCCDQSFMQARRGRSCLGVG
jgi:hypothetical protein